MATAEHHARFRDDADFLLSSIGSESTGIEGVVVWFSAAEFSGTDAHHGPRIQIALVSKPVMVSLADSVSVTLTSPPRVLGSLPADVAEKVIEFVTANHEALLRHWHCEADSADVLERLVSVAGP